MNCGKDAGCALYRAWPCVPISTPNQELACLHNQPLSRPVPGRLNSSATCESDLIWHDRSAFPV